MVRSNNSPHTPARLFFDTVKEVKGCPLLLRTDCGTENGMMAAMQCYFRSDGTDALAGEKSYKYGTTKELKTGGRILEKCDLTGGLIFLRTCSVRE